MLVLISIVFIIVIVLAIVIYIYHKQMQKTIKKLEQNYGKIPSLKYNEKRAASISSYWKYKSVGKNELLSVDDLTWKDLDMQKVYMRINSTCSSVGEEYLYNTLRTQNLNIDDLSKLECVIQYFDQHPKERIKTQIEMLKIGKVTGNGAVEFLSNLENKTLKHGAIYVIMAVAAVLSVLSLIPLSYLGTLPILIVWCINSLIYYNKNNFIEADMQPISYISSLLICAKKISGLQVVGLKEYTSRLRALRVPLKSIEKLAMIMANNPTGILGDLQEALNAIISYVKIFFMLDFLAYSRVVSIIKKRSKEAIQIYEILGLLDMAISIGSFRKSLKYYSTPTFTNSNEIVIQDMIHLLTSEPIANSVVLNRSSIVTGSNASGKSTFIKAVALNSILAQTINTCTAVSFSIKPSYILTSMAIEDNVEMGESYYIAEIRSIKRILDTLDNNVRCLFFIDEILKGTNTIERIAASSAFLYYLKDKNCLAIIATHDIELTEILGELFENYHFQEHITNLGVEFDYKIYKGPSKTRNAIKLLELMKYQAEIIDNANELVTNFEQNRTWKKL